MKTITGEEDFLIPILFLFVCSVTLGREVSMLYENWIGSVVLIEPILFADSISTTIYNFSKFLVPVGLFIVSLKQKSILLKITYILGTVPFILSNSVINKLGYKSLFEVKMAILFIVSVLLIIYLLRVTELYKIQLKQNTR